MKILVSGASGFVGKNLSDFLFERKIDVVKINLRGKLPDSLPQVDAVVHLAGKAHDLRGNINSDEYFRVNTELTKRLFELFLKSSSRDFIFFSSVKAVADKVEVELFEDFVACPRTLYGSSKQQAEDYISSISLPVDKRLFILRPCMIHGPGNKGNLNLLYQVVKKGIPYPLGNFDNKRSFLSINNLLFIIEKILTNPLILGGIYNVADDEPLSTIEVVKLIGVAFNRPSRVWKVSSKLIFKIAKIGDILHLPLNTERLSKLTESYVVNNTKIKSALNIEALPTTSRDGLIKTIESFGSN